MIVSCGIAIEIHYCMGKNIGLNYFAKSDGKCGKCGMKEKKGGCCSDEHRLIKLSDVHKNVFNHFDFSEAQIIALPISYHPIFNWQISKTENFTSYNNRPPPVYNKPLAFILNCVFRI